MTIYYRDFKNLVIDGPPAHQRDVVGQLNKVWATWTGWAVLRSLIDSPRTVTIVPFSATDDEKTTGAAVRPAWWLRMMDGTPEEGQKFQGGEDDPSTPEDERYRLVPLLRGTDGPMHELANLFEDHNDMPLRPRDGTVSKGPCRIGCGTAAYGWDCVLVHELVHAVRFLRGPLNPVPTWDKGYDHEEEFFAILVGNIYLSEKGRTLLVTNQHGYAALPARLSTSAGFLGKGALSPSRRQLENRRLVQKFVCQNYGLCAYLSGKVTGAFNPVREFMRNSQLYPLVPRR